jgi:hypothetical protein
MPTASRACGDKIWRTGVFGGAFFFAGARRAGRFRCDEEVLRRLVDARRERREGEVFVAMEGSV